MTAPSAPPATVGSELQAFAQQFVASTREYVHVRPEDRLLILRPNKTHHLNATACDLLVALYAQPEVDVDRAVRDVAAAYAEPPERVAADLDELLHSLERLLNDDPARASRVRFTPFKSHEIRFPVLSEIALTYRCTHRCAFCYADARARGSRRTEMTTTQVRAVIDRIRDEAKVPTISFTGGEPTVRPDLPELISYARGKGMRVNLITNGFKCARPEYVGRLAAAGLHSAQVSLEAPQAEVHDAITGRAGSFARTVRGARNLRAAGIHTHTNTTICPDNRSCLVELVDFVADELQHEYLSLNVVIRTGTAVAQSGPATTVDYSEVGEIMEPVIARARQRGVRLVWYSPVPLCIFNPIVAGLGSNSCAAADGLLSVAPNGDVLPCSSFERGIGNLLRQPFERVWHTRTARYWRRKEFLPPVCAECELQRICCGACPLYWDEVGDFAELVAAQHPQSAPPSAARRWWRETAWRLKRRAIGRLRGVGL